MDITQIPLKYFFEVNSYLIKTETGYILIDTGISKRRDQLEKAIMDAGCHPGDLRLLIITHGHLDHVGNAVYLRDKFGAKIAMHRGDAGMAESGDMFVDQKRNLLMDLIGVFMGLLGMEQERFTPDIFLEDNQSLSEYGFNAKVLHMPGHSKGSISILTDDGELFCGDIIMNTKKPERTTLIDDHDQLDASVEKIRAIDSSVVYPGHGKPFSMGQFTE